VPASPAPFTPSGLVGVGTGLPSITTAQKLSARGSGVVHKRAGEHLSGLVIGFLLHQHLTQALDNAPHDLFLD
jgi:hypothetical protein